MLDPIKLELFKKLYSSFALKADAVEFFGLDYRVMDMVVMRGTGSPETITTIEEKIEQSKTTQ